MDRGAEKCRVQSSSKSSAPIVNPNQNRSSGLQVGEGKKRLGVHSGNGSGMPGKKE